MRGLVPHIPLRSRSARIIKITGTSPAMTGETLSLRFDPRDADVFSPRLFLLNEQCLRDIGGGDERIAAEFVEELAGIVHHQDLIEPLVDLIDDRARRRAWQMHRPPRG